MRYKVDYKALGLQIRYHRHLLKLTQAQLAERADISVQFMGNLERGVSIPSLETLVTLSYELDVSLDQLLCDSLPEDRFDREPVTKLRSVKTLLRNTLSDWLLDTDEGDDPLAEPVDLSKLPPIGFMTLDEEFPDHTSK
ncbi:MAG: helix-turn-helix transcriptional regulator [Clostridia bacterium]|nr:helix-turn-helix transcriptional regulator [Clostridia bacterium]